MRVLMTGGGTGGHVYPALAIAEYIKAKEPDSEIAFVGTEKGIENKLVPKAGYKLYHVQIQGISRSLSPRNIKTAYLIMVSPAKAKKIIKEFRPDIVIGTGGYVCWPLLRAAASMGVPCMVHESNAYAGLAVRQVQGSVDKVLTSFEETAERLRARDKIVNVGNPLRMNCAAYSKTDARRKLGIADGKDFVVLSFGGSLGAKGINDAAMEIMRSFSSKKTDTLHYHACGSRFFEEFSKQAQIEGLDKNQHIVISDYIFDMPLYMAAADVVICRAGAMTLSELAMMGKPAILIPSPNVTDDHQYKNAKVVADRGGAFLVKEGEETAARVCKAVESLWADKKLRNEMSKAMSALARPDAGERIYSEILKLTEKKK